MLRGRRARLQRGGESIGLGPLLVGLADATDADDCRTSSVTLSDGLPAVWFPTLNRPRVVLSLGYRYSVGPTSGWREQWMAAAGGE
jgi:hypothetical protein